MKNKFLLLVLCLFVGLCSDLSAQYVHPGMNHTKADLDRVKQKVLAGEHPWIDGWNAMCAERDARADFKASPKSTVGGSDGTRQRASRDATAAYYNILRWYVTGDESHARCAVDILNAWSSSIKSVVTGELLQLPIRDFLQAAEIVRLYPGWKTEDIERFKTMCRDYFYPACKDGRSHAWPGWGGPANSDCLYIGIFLDDKAMVEDAVEYYKNGEGGGRMTNGVAFDGQPVEMGRDQPHAAIGIDSYAEFCQALWNQGIDMFSYKDNLLMKGFEYFYRFNLNHPVEWTPIDYSGHKFYYPATSNNSPASMPQNRIYANELAYHHYADRMGLDVPNMRKMVNLKNIGILTGVMFNYTDTSTVYIHRPVPPAPTELNTAPGISQVYLSWKAPDGDIANGYDVQRSESVDGAFVDIASWTENTSTDYTDRNVKPGVTYYYRVRSKNQSGTSDWSDAVAAKAVEGSTVYPSGWTRQDLGKEDWMVDGVTLFDTVRGNSFVIKGSGRDIYNPAQPEGNFTYVYVDGDFELTTRVYDGEQNGNQLKEKFGIMVRESVDASSPKVMLWIGDNGTRFTNFIWRGTSDGGGWINGSDHTWIPLWLRLRRTGNVFEAYVSAYGDDWHLIGSSEIPFANGCLVGLWVCGGAGRAEGYTVSFDNTSLTVGATSRPSAPSSFKATAKNSTQVQVSWNKPAGASCFTLSRAQASDRKFVDIARNLHVLSFSDNSLEPSTDYIYALTAANAGGESDTVFAEVTTKELKLPSAPSGLVASAKNSCIKLSWQPTLEQTEKYIVRRRGKNILSDFVYIGETEKTDYVDSTVMNDSIYYYRVCAVNSLGEGSPAGTSKLTPVLGEEHCFPFNEAVNDESADEWDVSDEAVLHDASFVAGKFDKCISLDKNRGSYVELNKGIVDGFKDFTVCAWVYPSRLDTWARVFDFGNNTDFYMFLSVRDASGKVRYAIDAGNGEQGLSTEVSLSTGRWTHLAVSQNDSVVIVYVNGKEVARSNTFTICPSDLGVTTCNYVGRSQFSSDPLFSGRIDELRIYSQTLTASQIERIYKAKSQSISMDAEAQITADVLYYDPASASSGLPVSYSTDDSKVASVYKDQVRIRREGTVNITASQRGNLDYAPAPKVVQHLTVSVADGISDVDSDEGEVYEVQRFNISGFPVDAPCKGINIVKYSDGSVKKVLVK